MNVFQEFLKCQENFDYFTENYITVKHPQEGLSPLKLYPFQRKFIDLCESEKFLSVIKFRQGGFTTLAVYYALWKCMFFQNQHFLFISKTEREAKHLARLLKLAFDLFPDWIVPQLTVDKDTKKTFLLTRSSITFCSPQTARGRSATHVIFDEAAFIPNIEKHWSEIWPIIAQGKTTIISTTNGIKNWFFNICYDETVTLYKPSYKEHPYYADDEVCSELKATLGEKRWQQEILGNFVSNEIPYEEQSNVNLAESLLTLGHKKKLSQEELLLIKEITNRLINL